MSFPRISFGIIVLNGEPFTRYCLRALYPFAHEIIVVEGAVSSASHNSTPTGHSTDGTLECLYRFKEEEDAENKVHIITQDGFWSEKDEMSQAYAARATGDYLWQVDVDEFYKSNDMQAIIDMLTANPGITAVSFKMITFWGSPKYVADGWILRRGEAIYHRLFRWGPGYRYVTHRPPTVVAPDGTQLRNLLWVGGNELAKRGIYLYHYSLLFPKQVREKSDYYEQGIGKGYSGGSDWVEHCYMNLQNPFRVHNVIVLPSWLDRFAGTHPMQFRCLWDDIAAGRLSVEVRATTDVETLLNSRAYRLARLALIVADHADRLLGGPFVRMRRAYEIIRGRLAGRVSSAYKKQS